MQHKLLEGHLFGMENSIVPSPVCSRDITLDSTKAFAYSKVLCESKKTVKAFDHKAGICIGVPELTPDAR